MPEYYNENQVDRIIPYCNDVDCFIVGGPSDGNEGQRFREYNKDCLIIGVEPNPNAYQFQLDHDFPGTLINRALHSKYNRRMKLTVTDNIRCSRLSEDSSRHPIIDVHTITLDKIDKYRGHFKNIALWIDIEGSEIECLKGAHYLLSKKYISVMNIEVNNETDLPIRQMLDEYGYRVIERVDIRYLPSDRVFSDIVVVRK